MDRVLLIYPVFAMIILTFVVMVKMRIVMTKYVKSKELSFGYFKLYRGEVPEEVDQARHNFKNLFEMPVLFYLLVALIYSTNNLNLFDLIFAWFFVFFKYIHAYIRMTSNYVPNRAKIFILSLVPLLCGWINLIINL